MTDTLIEKHPSQQCPCLICATERCLLEAVDTLECLRRGHGIEIGAKCTETLNLIRPTVEILMRTKIEGKKP